MIKAVMFDLDNTIIDFMRMKRLSCEEAMTAMIDAGLDISKEKGMKILFDLYDKYGMEHQRIFQVFLRKTLGRVDMKILSNGIVAYRRIKSGFLVPYPGVKSTLLKIKLEGIKLAIVTDAPRMQAWLRLAEMKLTDFFDVVVTFDDTGKKKPHSLPFEAALNKLKLKPEEVLMVGDWPEKDIKGAANLGMKTCFARYGMVKKFKKPGADFEINSFVQVLDVIDKLNN